MNLNPFKEINLFNAGTSFFNQLNIPLNSNTTTSLHLKDILKDNFKSQEIFEKVSTTYFLGLVDKSVFDTSLSLFDDGNVTFDQAVEKIHADYEFLRCRLTELIRPQEHSYPISQGLLTAQAKACPLLCCFNITTF